MWVLGYRVDSVLFQTETIWCLREHYTRQLGLIPVSYLVDVPGLVIKYVNMIPAAELLYIREKLLRFRPAMRNCKSIEEAGSQSPVEVSLPTNNTSNNYLFQLSDELILRILTSLDVKDLIR